MILDGQPRASDDQFWETNHCCMETRKLGDSCSSEGDGQQLHEEAAAALSALAMGLQRRLIISAAELLDTCKRRLTVANDGTQKSVLEHGTLETDCRCWSVRHPDALKYDDLVSLLSGVHTVFLQRVRHRAAVLSCEQ